MNFNNKKIQISAIVVLFIFQLMFAQYTSAYFGNTEDIRDSILAISSVSQDVSEDVNGLPEAGDREPIRRISVPMTAYSSTPDQTDDTPFITASGTHVRDGIVAANFLPIGTRVRIPELYGDKVFIVEDRMNARYHYKMDFWMETREEAMNFGLQYAEVEIF